MFRIEQNDRINVKCQDPPRHDILQGFTSGRMEKLSAVGVRYQPIPIQRRKSNQKNRETDILCGG
jgi:hypothetical protein